ncbi:D-isomer specific 2-hydroxyacid dehydrogenase [Mycena leptocephala]|nr:D-isomer specific 2-hydroxyacid dehydrogenase [Mycena leptocephala]
MSLLWVKISIFVPYICLSLRQVVVGQAITMLTPSGWPRRAYYCNTPTAISVSTANGALMLILAATRAVSQGDFYTRAGKWRGDASVPGDFFPLGQDIEGMTLGIIGLGSIGKALAARAQACGMKIIYHNRRRVPESEENGAKYVSKDELLAASDVISVNCPLTAETRHLLGPAEFTKMKTGVLSLTQHEVLS